MKPAVIFSLPATTSHGYCWRWRSVDGTTDSAGQFAFYHDCLGDAQANGYAVQLNTAHGIPPPIPTPFAGAANGGR
jgi:hypothetical protein